jgi:hypothetical protein
MECIKAAVVSDWTQVLSYLDNLAGPGIQVLGASHSPTTRKLAGHWVKTWALSCHPQDVSHAIELILAIIELAKSHNNIINNSFSLNINTLTDLKSINLLSALIDSFLTLFINMMLSLSEQIQYLSHYTHLTFAFFHAHWCSFMSYQLYYNTQTAVKNIMFCYMKQ